MQTEKVLQGIDTVIIRVSNVQQSKEWYQNKLGLAPAYEDNNTKLVVLDTGGPTGLTLWQTDAAINNDKATASFPIFRTTDAKAARQNLLTNGVEVSELVSYETVTFFQFFDPDKNMLEACQVND